MKESALEYINKHQLISFMNETKWKQLIQAVSSINNFTPSVNIKLIFDRDNGEKFSPVWWDKIEKDGFELIEYLKINPIKEEYVGRLAKLKLSDYSDLIIKSLEKYNIHFDLSEGIFIIYGYKRAS